MDFVAAVPCCRAFHEVFPSWEVRRDRHLVEHDGSLDNILAGGTFHRDVPAVRRFHMGYRVLLWDRLPRDRPTYVRRKREPAAKRNSRPSLAALTLAMTRRLEMLDQGPTMEPWYCFLQS
jgi:hypothetical protein